jgi:Cys-tRNA(Pro)/Cys-tRNA(Cys) deacylase
MPKSTPATLALRKLGIAFKLHSYIYDSTIPSGGIGLQAAEALGVEPARVLKTLMAEVDGLPVCVVVPSDCEVSMKKLAAALGGKSANMMRPADAERITGYHVGGISPFGQKKKVRVAIEQAALANLTVFVNGGQRGLQIEIDPNDAAIAAGAHAHALMAE